MAYNHFEASVGWDIFADTSSQVGQLERFQICCFCHEILISSVSTALQGIIKGESDCLLIHVAYICFCFSTLVAVRHLQREVQETESSIKYCCYWFWPLTMRWGIENLTQVRFKPRAHRYLIFNSVSCALYPTGYAISLFSEQQLSTIAKQILFIKIIIKQ